MHTENKLMLDGDWLHKLGDNIVSAVAGAAAGIFGTLLSRASKKEVAEIRGRLEKIENEQGLQRVSAAKMEAKLDGLHEDMKRVLRLLEKQREDDE